MPDEEQATAEQARMRNLIPQLDDGQLTNLHRNAARLAQASGDRRSDEASVLLPLLETELQQRRAVKLAAAAETRKARPKKVRA